MSNQAEGFTCIRCEKEFDYVTPKMELVGGETVTMMVWAHPKPQICPHCNQHYQIKIAKIEGLALALLPIKSNNESKIIQPPAGLQIPH